MMRAGHSRLLSGRRDFEFYILVLIATLIRTHANSEPPSAPLPAYGSVGVPGRQAGNRLPVRRETRLTLVEIPARSPFGLGA